MFKIALLTDRPNRSAPPKFAGFHDPLRLISFASRVLPFDSAAASVHAEIAAARRAMGRPMPETDRQIATITRSPGMAMVTPNVRDFADAGIDVIDPWTDT